MIKRPVFLPTDIPPYVHTHIQEFLWEGDQSSIRKKANVPIFHDAFHQAYPAKKVLEISTKSDIDLGVKLSAFNLEKYVPSLGRSVTVECIYQSSKVFLGGGPYTELLGLSSREAKLDPRIASGGRPVSFRFQGIPYPARPVTAFFTWLYVSALLEHPELSDRLLDYDAFTDIEFDPAAGINCQARAAALFTALRREGLVDHPRDFDWFLKLLR
ncbi:MAG: hypothetical protein IJ960_01325 [Oscillospiraceae bacterium]|nr:hypothetical protein [Oscillospiraceae bacterium]